MIKQSSKKLAILQSNYIPWRGYFNLIMKASEFIIYDNVQYTKNDWRNRNIIKTSNGLCWLSIPIGGKIKSNINEIELGKGWQSKHWKTIEYSYKKSKYFDEITNLIKPIYFDEGITLLSDFNIILIKKICGYLSIKTKISNVCDYHVSGEKNHRLIELCKLTNSDIYISGPSAKNYINEDLFLKNDIKIEWATYDNFPSYPQLWGAYEERVSILDMLFNCGKSSVDYILPR